MASSASLGRGQGGSRGERAGGRWGRQQAGEGGQDAAPYCPHVRHKLLQILPLLRWRSVPCYCALLLNEPTQCFKRIHLQPSQAVSPNHPGELPSVLLDWAGGVSGRHVLCARGTVDRRGTGDMLQGMFSTRHPFPHLLLPLLQWQYMTQGRRPSLPRTWRGMKCEHCRRMPRRFTWAGVWQGCTVILAIHCSRSRRVGP